ncbi:polynucleotide phosphorylase [Clostridium peptidivorans]|uniref:polynucleotide phosphorylase n=1 Tax=Clostridium peptidivorans TaxID=100174 RepID=UPI001FA84066|nr:polynucleotide phosphorylase [Clostridium peptidivorans]
METIKYEVINMNNNNTNSNKNLALAPLQEQQEKRIREVENQFNTEFGTDYYLMAMKKD